MQGSTSLIRLGAEAMAAGSILRDHPRQLRQNERGHCDEQAHGVVADMVSAT